MTPEPRWKISKVGNLLSPPWVVHGPDGGWDGRYATLDEAIASTSLGDVVEDWLKGLDFFTTMAVMKGA